jgi:hypothetical protein
MRQLPERLLLTLLLLAGLFLNRPVWNSELAGIWDLKAEKQLHVNEWFLCFSETIEENTPEEEEESDGYSEISTTSNSFARTFLQDGFGPFILHWEKNAITWFGTCGKELLISFCILLI